MPDMSSYFSNLLLQNLFVPGQHAAATPGGAGGYDMDAARKSALDSVYDSPEDQERYKQAHLSNALAIIRAQQAVRASQQMGTMAKLKTEQDWNQQNPYPQQEELPSQGAFPRFNAPTVPARGSAQVDPISRMLAGIGAGLAPSQFSGDILASPLRGALEHSNQVYEDKLKSYQMLYQQAQQAHEDDLTARNEEAKRLAYNASVKYGNRLGAYKAGHDYLEQVTGPMAEIQTDRAAAPYVDMNQEAAARAGANVEGIDAEIKAKQEVSKEKARINELFAGPAARFQGILAQNAERMEQQRQRDEATLTRQNAEDKAKTELEGIRNKGKMEVEGARGATAVKVAGIRSEASKFGSTARAEATIKAAEIRADAPSKSQSGELKGASMYFRQAKRELRRFELENPLNLRLVDNDKGAALRHQWTQLHDDVLDAADQVNAAKDETPMPSNPIGRTGQKKSGGIADFMKRHGIR